MKVARPVVHGRDHHPGGADAAYAPGLWIAMTPILISPWTAAGAPYHDPEYRIGLDDNYPGWNIELRGAVSGGAVDDPIAQLPTGFRPGATVVFVMPLGIGGVQAATVIVDTDGFITPTGFFP